VASVTDSKNNMPQVTVVSDNVDTGTPGSYQVVFRASDKYGNETTATLTVTVTVKTGMPVLTASSTAAINALDLKAFLQADLTAGGTITFTDPMGKPVLLVSVIVDYGSGKMVTLTPEQAKSFMSKTG